MVDVNGQGIEDVDRFVYLGATVSKEGGGTEDIQNRVAKARRVFLRLKKIWSSHSISIRFSDNYCVVVLSVLVILLFSFLACRGHFFI